MTSKRDLTIAVLITFCLTATLFTIVPTKSGEGSSYDSWKDLNDDGVIDSTDLGMLGTSWATTGAPTKNVIMNHNAYQWSTFIENLAPNAFYYFYNTTIGFAEMTFYVYTTQHITVNVFMAGDKQSWEVGARQMDSRTFNLHGLEGVSVYVINSDIYPANVSITVVMTSSLSQVTVKRDYYSSVKWFTNMTRLGIGYHSCATAGYDRVSIFIIVYHMNVTIQVSFMVQGCGPFPIDEFTVYGWSEWSTTVHKSYDVMGDTIGISFTNIGANEDNEIASLMYITA
jgi:hypothetical protein